MTMKRVRLIGIPGQVTENGVTRSYYSWTQPGSHIEAFKFLVKRGAKLCTAVNGATPLMEAVDKGKRDMVEYLIKMATSHDLDLNHKDRDGANVLFYCVAGGHLSLFKFLLNAGCDVTIDNHGRNILMQATLSGHAQMVQYIVKHAQELVVDVHKKDNSGRNVLFYAVESKHLDLLDYLLKCGIKPCIDNNGRTLLMQGSRVGSYNIVTYLLDLHNDLGSDYNFKDINGENAIFYAVRSKSMEIIKLLLQKQIEISSNHFGVNVLSQSMSEGREEIVQAILNSDVDISKAVNGKDTKGRSIFHHCIMRGDFNMLRQLSRYYDNDADGDHDGITCLMKACQQTDINIIKYLVEAMKVDTNKTDLRNRNALFYAAEASNTAALSYLLKNIDRVPSDNEGKSVLMATVISGDIKLSNILLNSKFGRELAKSGDKKKQNSCHYAASLGRETILSLLSTHGCSFDVQDEEGVTPLMCACANGHYATASILLRNGAQVETLDNRKRSALHHCFGDSPSLKCVKVLINYDADPNEPDDVGVTALMLACQTCTQTNIPIITYLLDHGADPIFQDDEGRDAFDYCPFNADYVKAMLKSKSEIPASEKQAIEEYKPRLLEEVEINSVLRGLLRKQIFTKTLDFEVKKRPAVDRVSKLLEIMVTRGETAFRVFCRILKEDCNEPELAYCLQKAAYRRANEVFV